MLLFASLGSVALFLAGLALVTGILLRRTYRQIGRRRKRRPEGPVEHVPRPTSSWAGAYSDSFAALERQTVEIAETRRELVAQADSKALLLREMITQSERQIARLEELLAELQEHQTPRVPID